MLVEVVVVVAVVVVVVAVVVVATVVVVVVLWVYIYYYYLHLSRHFYPKWFAVNFLSFFIYIYDTVYAIVDVFFFEEYIIYFV